MDRITKRELKQGLGPPRKISQILPQLRKRQKFAFVSDDLFIEACAYISTGMSVKSVCELEGMPNQLSFYKKLAENDVNKQIYLRAREAGMLVFSEDVLAIADNARGDTFRDKLRIETRFRLMSSYARALFGDNVQIEGNPSKPIVIKWADSPSTDNGPMVQGDSAKLVGGTVNPKVIDHDARDNGPRSNAAKQRKE